MFSQLILVPFLLFTIYRIYNLIKHYVAARKLGLPIILLPVSFEDVWWMPLRPLFSWVEHLPFGLGSWYAYTELGWPTIDGYRTPQRLGETFILCSPFGIQINTCYPPAVNLIFRDPKDWKVPDARTRLWTLYGENVASSNDTEWYRHRRIVASSFNENTMQRVWGEAIKRAASLELAADSERSLGRIWSTFDVLAMGILAVVGFGQEDMALTSTPPGHRESLMECLGFILRHITMSLIFSGLRAPDFLLPKILRRLKLSVSEFKRYMQETVLYNMRQASAKPSQSRATSLLEAMVRANEAAKQQHDSSAKSSSHAYLTDSELYGNLFLFNLAGYETTASTMTMSLPFLAANPHIQAWVTEEIDAHYTKDYTATYPKLVRCLAVMYETLRLSSPAPTLVRTPAISPQELPVATTPTGEARTITVEPGTVVAGHIYGAHLSPRWGADAHTFNPKRFIVTSTSASESLVVPEKPVYMPWMFGPRVCPGKKFSQVEFVAVVAHILSEYRIEVLRRDGESEEAARERLVGVLNEKFFDIGTHLRRPEDAGVRFVKR
ncbi:hypothetical protein AJ79_04608 [Helicocarpus griseus UAMH5409]|uniref:Cytochrome P450 n=1 Tax=Helicocarpus griseus UAMH5409 TaxID=1447875 RepID=A0A2B7XRR0_9EURO|nr:hypothetical protein AJ79_04608 [Helicocarpus griseus UAMH5409]